MHAAEYTDTAFCVILIKCAVTTSLEVHVACSRLIIKPFFCMLRQKKYGGSKIMIIAMVKTTLE